MKKMTTEEKLKIAIDFIKSIESYEPNYEYVESFERDNTSFISKNAILELKDRAWHILADLSE